MGIHHFNPPEPCCNPHRDCGNCTGVPCKWLLKIPAYGSNHAVDLLLNRVGKTGCSWGLMVGLGVHPPETRNHLMFRAWRLSFAPFVNVGQGQFTQPGYIQDWVVWIEGRQTGSSHAVGGDSVYYRTTPLNVANHPDYDLDNFNSDLHFACLGPNQFYYWQGFNDPFGEGPGPLFGWPNELTVVPWYGKDKS
jgi:hypothetical protein